jgi:hypothetical protein
MLLMLLMLLQPAGCPGVEQPAELPGLQRRPLGRQWAQPPLAAADRRTTPAGRRRAGVRHGAPRRPHRRGAGPHAAGGQHARAGAAPVHAPQAAGAAAAAGQRLAAWLQPRRSRLSPLPGCAALARRPSRMACPTHPLPPCCAAARAQEGAAAAGAPHARPLAQGAQRQHPAHVPAHVPSPASVPCLWMPAAWPPGQPAGINPVEPTRRRCASPWRSCCWPSPPAGSCTSTTWCPWRRCWRWAAAARAPPAARLRLLADAQAAAGLGDALQRSAPHRTALHCTQALPRQRCNLRTWPPGPPPPPPAPSRAGHVQRRGGGDPHRAPHPGALLPAQPGGGRSEGGGAAARLAAGARARTPLTPTAACPPASGADLLARCMPWRAWRVCSSTPSAPGALPASQPGSSCVTRCLRAGASASAALALALPATEWPGLRACAAAGGQHLLPAAGQRLHRLHNVPRARPGQVGGLRVPKWP